MTIRLLIALVLASAGCGSGSGSGGAPASQTAPPSSAALMTITSKSSPAVEHFRKGESLFFNVRTTEAANEFSEALKLDPDFVLAHVFHGQSVPGPEGLKELEVAAAGASGLPEAERLFVEAALADRRGESAKRRELATRLTQAAPGDWRSHNMLGFFLLDEHKFADAIPSLRKATELNPQAGSAYNLLGYAALRQGDTGGAIAAFTEYARAMPQEPNAQDSLGEALMAAGRFDEAVAAFRKAEDLSPQFWNAEQGIAYARFFAGNAPAAREALTKARAIAPRPVDKLDVDDVLAAVAAAEGSMAEALRVLAAAEKTADALPSSAFASIHRAMVLVGMKRYRESLPLDAVALQRADSGELPESVSRELRVQALRARIAAEAGLSDAAGAQRTAAALADAAKARTDDLNVQSSMQYGAGMLAMMNGDFASARAHFEQCLTDDHFCRLEIVTAADRSGDKPGAQAARTELLKVYLRNPIHVIVRSRLTQSLAAR